MSVRSQVKSLIRRSLPQGAIDGARFVLQELPRTLEKRRTARLFAAAPDAPAHLDALALPALQARYGGPPDYDYDPRAVESRGLERAGQLLRLPGARAARDFLEIGCWDGMVSWALQRQGKAATAIDNRDQGFDPRARAAGVTMLQMDAARLSFPDESFDFVFSYDAFEHVASPEDVLREAIRVVRKGGHVYLEFGPLYYSPFGEHAYRTITVPYCQVLFTRDALDDFARRSGLAPIDYAHVNGWSLERYRALWKRHADVLQPVRYREGANLAHLDLIRAHPSCFKSKSRHFEDFTQASISALFRRVA